MLCFFMFTCITSVAMRSLVGRVAMATALVATPAARLRLRVWDHQPVLVLRGDDCLPDHAGAVRVRAALHHAAAVSRVGGCHCRLHHYGLPCHMVSASSHGQLDGHMFSAWSHDQ